MKVGDLIIDTKKKIAFRLGLCRVGLGWKEVKTMNGVDERILFFFIFFLLL